MIENTKCVETSPKMLPKEDLLIGQTKNTPTQTILCVRNALVVFAVTMFLLSFAGRGEALRAIGYISGALAYVCEILVLTDCFKIKIPHNDLFMPYCFGPLYLIMGIGYLMV